MKRWYLYYLIAPLALAAAHGVEPDTKAVETLQNKILPGGEKTTFVNGFSAIVSASNKGAYQTQREGSRGSFWIYTIPNNKLVWKTAPAPALLDTPQVTFAWDCVLTGIGNSKVRGYKGPPLQYKLHLGEKHILTFTTGISGDTRWPGEEGSGAELFFDMTKFDAFLDLAGTMYLTLPSAAVSAGQPLEITAIGADGGVRAFFMLSDYTDSVTYALSGKITENPDVFIDPKTPTKDDFYYDGSGYLKLIERKGEDRWDGLDELKARLTRPRTVNKSCERAIFRDSYTRVEKWLLTRSNSKHHYSSTIAFNANGAIIKMGMLYDMTTATPALWKVHGGGEWDRVRPYICYAQDGNNTIYEINIKTGERKNLCKAQGRLQFWWPQSDDGKFVWWVEGAQDSGYMVGSLSPDGRTNRVNVGGGVHQAYLVREPQKRGNYWLYTHNHDAVDQDGNRKPVNHHAVVDLVTGERPIPAFGGVHEAHSPDGWAIAASFAHSMYPEKMPPHRIVSVVDPFEMHTSWNSFERNWAAESYNCNYGSEIIKVNPWTDDVVIIGSAGQNPPTHYTWQSLQFANLSPDGTKVLYYSSMLQTNDLGQEYILVAKYPEAPLDVQVKKEGSKAQITWKPHELSREIRGYHVLRSTASGSGYEVISTGLLTGTEFVDEMPPAGPCFYRVRAQENSGLVSPFSAEATLDAGQAPRWVFAEAELGRYKAPMRVTMDGRCSGMHLTYISEYPQGVAGSLELSPVVPAKGDYEVWVRAAAAKDGSFNFDVAGKSNSLDLKTSGWQWLKLAQVAAPAGPLSIRINTSSPGLMFDRFILTTDPKTAPEGLGRLDRASPAAPTDLAAEKIRNSDLLLKWKAPNDRDIRHFNVYCSDKEDFKCDQARLVLSPPAESTEVFDWALPKGAVVYYRMTAVDWSGNESQPSAPLKVELVKN